MRVQIRRLAVLMRAQLKVIHASVKLQTCIVVFLMLRFRFQMRGLSLSLLLLSYAFAIRLELVLGHVNHVRVLLSLFGFVAVYTYVIYAQKRNAKQARMVNFSSMY